jgi:hypothetical protein
MDVENAAGVLAGSILVGLSFIIFVITIVVINNILNKYWKPVKIFTADSWQFNPPQRFVREEELMEFKEPTIDAREIKTSSEVKATQEKV